MTAETASREEVIRIVQTPMGIFYAKEKIPLLEKKKGIL